MWGRAQLLVLLALLSAHGEELHEDNLKVGRSVDIFSRFGYLSLSMKVVPRNDTGWIFREPTVDIFSDVEQLVTRPEKMPRRQKRVFDGDFHMEFCDNVRQLVQAYFRDFNFERLDKPWRAFTGSWSPELIARNMGINTSFVTKDSYSYVLVRISRFRETVRLSRVPTNINLSDVAENEIANVKVGDVASVLVFIKKYGSHYIDSYVTGNSLYQVFAYQKPVYEQLKRRLKTKGIAHISDLELLQFFGPWYSEHVGLIRVASGNKTVEEWASNKLRVNYFILTYPNLLKIHGNPELLSVLNGLLQNEAILEMNMKSLTPAFKDPDKRKWFLEVLDNFLKLWENNL